MDDKRAERVARAREALASGRVKTRSNVVSLPCDVTADKLLQLVEQNLKAAKALNVTALALVEEIERKKK